LQANDESYAKLGVVYAAFEVMFSYSSLSKTARFALFILLLLCSWFVIAPFSSKFDARSPDWDLANSPPSLQTGHYFGTDAIGRDLYVRTAQGGRLSLIVGVAAAGIALVIGTLYGAIAGFAGGAWGDWMMRGVDLCATLPFLLIVVFVMTIVEPSLALLIILLASYGCLDVARVVRLEAASLREKGYMQAVQTMGFSPPRQLFVHLLPNLLPFALLALTLAIPSAVLMESFLSFLGVSPVEASGSLGSLLSEGMQDRDYAPWTLIIPAVVLTLLLYALQELTDGLKSALGARVA
jgi:oligopeptide transport system permease protein